MWNLDSIKFTAKLCSTDYKVTFIQSLPAQSFYKSKVFDTSSLY